MNKKIELQKKTELPFYNICIVDKSHIYALGLKNSIEKSLKNTADSHIIYQKSLEDIGHLNLSNFDIIFIDYNEIILPDFDLFFSELKRKNQKLKLIVSSAELLNVDFLKLYSYNVNGLFTKSLSIKSFNIYFKRVLSQSVFFDNFSLVKAIEQEKKQKIRYYYKSISLQNLDLIQSRQLNFMPYVIDKNKLSSLEININSRFQEN